MSHSKRYDAMTERVRVLYERNRQRGTASWCGHDYDFVCPSTGTYPFQWFWDSCFHAIVLARYDMGRARSEIRSLLRNQPDDGFIGHVTFWQREAFEEMLKEYSIAYRTPHLSDCSLGCPRSGRTTGRRHRRSLPRCARTARSQ